MAPGGQTPPARRALTSVPLQVALYVGGWWDAVYVLLTLAIFIYKGARLPYPSASTYGMEIALTCILPVLEVFRIFLGSMGNKTERFLPMLLFMILSAGPVALYLFYITMQTYCLKIEEVLNSIALAFCGIQILLGIIALVTFQQATFTS